MADEDELRGTGRTTEQMKSAPRVSLFVTPGGYRAEGTFKHMAMMVGRDDMTIASAERLLADGGLSLMGREWGGIIVDHAVEVTGSLQQVLDRLLPYVRLV